ncbi:MAG: hypothetical protein IPK28_16105 [Devosia sp.]|nr:hypothetical protein [Devosia sp.]
MIPSGTAADGRPVDVRATLDSFGTFRLAVSGTTPSIRSRKSRAILAYLALAPHQRLRRTQLAGLLWSEATDHDARVSLRQQLATLKRELGGASHLVLSDRDEVWLSLPLAMDAPLLIGALKAGDVPEALVDRPDLFDSFLGDIEGVDPAFDYWLVVQRESYRSAVLHELRQLLAAGRADLQERAAIALRNIDPTNEEACRTLMRASMAQGDVAGALRLYNELWSLLDRDFDMEPGPETQAYVAQIKSTPLGMPVPAIAPGPVEGHILILVNAFDQEELTGEQQRRVNGLRHELIGALTRFRDWSVREAGRSLDVDEFRQRKTYEISVLAAQEAGELYISVILQRFGDGTYLWSQRIPVQLERWVTAKRDVIRRIASSLQVHLSAERVARTAGLADQTLDIHDRWLRGNSLIAHWQPQSERRAEGIFRSLIADAPGFPLAYVGVAQILTTRHHIFPGTRRDRSAELEALALAKTAVKLDPRDSRTHLCLAWSHLMVENYEQAMFSYELALQLNENDPWTLTSCAQGLSYCDQKQRARQLADRAIDVALGGAPMHWGYQMCIRFLEEDYRAAVNAADQAEGSAFFVPAWKAAALSQLGETGPARAAVAQFYRQIVANWHGTERATPVAVHRWFIDCFPIRRPADRDRLEHGVLGAGLLDLETA